MNSHIVLTLDIGSSSVRAILYDARAHAIPTASAQIKYQFRTTADGGVEMAADELLQDCMRVIDEVLARTDAKQISAVASDCFAMSILGADADGNAVTPIYTYADSRGAEEAARLRAKLDERTVHQRVGTLFHTSYLPARILWLSKERPEEFKRARYWMSFGEYLYFKFLNTRVVSHSVASWTGLLNRQTLDWDDELMAALPIARDNLSPIVDTELRIANCELRKGYAERWKALKEAAWFPTIGDGAAANLGSGCVDASRVALTVGTSSALRVARQGSKGAEEQGGTRARERGSRWAEEKVPWGLWAYRITRDIELIGGALNEGGNIFAWIQSVLQMRNENEVERELASMEPDAHGLTVLPFLAGERAPNWNAAARGMIIGLNLNTHPIHILRAGIEAVAYRLGLVYELLSNITRGSDVSVIASGGALMKSPTWVQMIADVLNAHVVASAEPEATSRGAALIALKGLGTIKSFDELSAQLGRIYEADLSRHKIYQRAIERQKKWYNLMLKENGEER